MTKGRALTATVDRATGSIGPGAERLSGRQAAVVMPSEKALAALEAAGRYAGKAHALAIWRAYPFDWIHYAA